MFFGKTTFAEDSFASQGIKDAFLLQATVFYGYWYRNSVSNVTVVPTGIAVSSTQASVTVFLPDITATPRVL